MGAKMPTGEFQNISLHRRLLKRVDAFRRQDPTFRSRAEVVKTAVVEFLRRNGVGP